MVVLVIHTEADNGIGHTERYQRDEDINSLIDKVNSGILALAHYTGIEGYQQESQQLCTE